MNLRVDKTVKKHVLKRILVVLVLVFAVWIGTLLHDFGAKEVEASRTYTITVWEPMDAFYGERVNEVVYENTTYSQSKYYSDVEITDENGNKIIYYGVPMKIE